MSEFPISDNVSMFGTSSWLCRHLRCFVKNPLVLKLLRVFVESGIFQYSAHS